MFPLKYSRKTVDAKLAVVVAVTVVLAIWLAIRSWCTATRVVFVGENSILAN